MRGRENGKVLLGGRKRIRRYDLQGQKWEYDKVKDCEYDGVKGHEKEWEGRRSGRGERTFDARVIAMLYTIFERS